MNKVKSIFIMVSSLYCGTLEAGQLSFTYGVMGCGKTTELGIQHNKSVIDGKCVVVLTYAPESEPTAEVTSRTGFKLPSCLNYNFEGPDEDGSRLLSIIQERNQPERIDHIYIDEAQFLTEGQTQKISDVVVDFMGISVFAFGLKTTFQGEMFAGSKKLIESADSTREMEYPCYCGCKAIYNARIDQEKGIISRDGELVLLGKSFYVSLCRRHFNSGVWKREDQ